MLLRKRHLLYIVGGLVLIAAFCATAVIFLLPMAKSLPDLLKEDTDAPNAIFSYAWDEQEKTFRAMLTSIEGTVLKEMSIPLFADARGNLTGAAYNAPTDSILLHIKSYASLRDSDLFFCNAVLKTDFQGSAPQFVFTSNACVNPKTDSTMTEEMATIWRVQRRGNKLFKVIYGDEPKTNSQEGAAPYLTIIDIANGKLASRCGPLPYKEGIDAFWLSEDEKQIFLYAENEVRIKDEKVATGAVLLSINSENCATDSKKVTYPYKNDVDFHSSFEYGHMVFSPDGKLAAMPFSIIDVRTGERVHHMSPSAEDRNINVSFSWSTDGQLVAYSIYESKTVYVYSVIDRTIRKLPIVTQHSQYGAVFIPNTHILSVHGYTKESKHIDALYDIDSGKELTIAYPLSLHGDFIWTKDTQ